MKSKVIAQPEVQAVLKDFVFAELYTDRKKDPRHKAQDAENARLQLERFATAALPLYVTLGPDGAERSRLAGVATTREFVEFLKKGLEPAPKTGRKE